LVKSKTAVFIQFLYHYDLSGGKKIPLHLSLHFKFIIILNKRTFRLVKKVLLFSILIKRICMKWNLMVALTFFVGGLNASTTDKPVVAA
jgi:hypothetical protein